MAIHHDPEYYPNPEVFDPERFSEEEKKKRHPYAFIPFGEGPRNCIGMRFGLLETKIALVSILKYFKVKLAENMKLPLEVDDTSLVLSALQTIWLEAEKI